MIRTRADNLTAITLAVFRLNGRLIEWGNQFAQPHGLTSARWQVLGAISMAPHPPTIPQIAAAMGVTRQGVLKQVNLLVGEGLVEPRPNPTHRRSPLHVLTARGQAAYDALVDRWHAHVRQMASEFTVPDLDATIRVLSVLSQLHADES